MVVHDESTLMDALTLVAQSPVRYSDKYVYMTYSVPGNLERALRKTLERNSIAVVVPVGQERTMELFPIEFRRVQARRRQQELKDVRKWIAEHPELKEAKTELEIVKLYRKLGRQEQ